MSAGTLYVAIKGDTKGLITALKSSKAASVKYGKASAKGFDPVNKAIASLKTQVLALGSVWLGAQGIKAMVQIADKYALIDSKIKLVTNGTEQFNSVYSELFNISQRTGSSFENNASNFTNLSLALKDTNITSEETLAIFEDVNRSLVVAGATTAEASSFMLQFRQAMGSGKLAGDEFRGMMESNSYWGGQLAKALDTDVAGLREMSKAGELTTATLMRAFPEMSQQIQSDFDGIEKTIARATVELGNAWKDVIADGNRATKGTKNLATSISDLATTVTNNKEEIVSAFIQGVQLAGSLLTTILNITESLKGWSAVGSDELDFLDFATMNAEELAYWLSEDGRKIRELEKYNKSMLDALKADRNEQRKWFGEKDLLTKAEKQGFVEQIKANKQYIRLIREGTSAITLSKSTYQDFGSAVKTTLSEATKYTENWGKKHTDVVKKMTEEEEKAAKKEKKRYELSVKNTNNKILALNGLVKAEKVAADSFMRLEELKTETVKEEDQNKIESFEDYIRKTGGLHKDLVSSFKLDFSDIGSMWDNLWKGMVETVVGSVMEIVAVKAATAIVDTVTDFVFNHDGEVSVKDDEQKTILQKGEMVIPKDEASIIRQNLSSFGLGNGSFDTLVRASDLYSGNGGGREYSGGEVGYMGGMDLSGDIAATLGNTLSKIGMGSLLGIDVDWGAMFGTSAAGRGISSTLGSFGTGVDTAFGITPSAYSSFGRDFMGTFGALGGGTPGAMAGIGLGGWLGDKFGDMMNDRDFESMRDAVEDETMTRSEYEARMGAAGNLGVDGGSTLGGIANALSGFMSDLADMTGITAVKATFRGMLDDIGSSLGGGSDGPEAGYGSSPGGDVSSGGYGRDLWSEGGVPTRVYGSGFGADDGFVSFKLGEGIVSPQGMKNLEKINDGSFGSGDPDIKAILLAIAAQTLKTVKTLENFRYSGAESSSSTSTVSSTTEPTVVAPTTSGTFPFTFPFVLG